MDDKKKLELAEEQLEEISGGCGDHDPNYYAVTPPCVRCAYKFMESGKSCPCCGASWEEQEGGFKVVDRAGTIRYRRGSAKE